MILLALLATGTLLASTGCAGAPHYTGADLVGTWVDGHGGSIVLAKTGQARLTDVSVRVLTLGRETNGVATGSGRWSIRPDGTGQYIEFVGVDMSPTRFERYSWVGDFDKSRDVLFFYQRDPDLDIRYELHRARVN